MKSIVTQISVKLDFISFNSRTLDFLHRFSHYCCFQMSLALGMEFMDDESEFQSIFPFIPKIGSGHSRTGTRKRWKKKHYFEQNLLERDFISNKYAGYTRDQISQLFVRVKRFLVRPRETDVHAQNKLAMWLDWLHNSLSWKNIREAYYISESSAIRYVKDVTTAILKSFEGTDIISFPQEPEKQVLREILKHQNAKMPDILFTFDGKDSHCNGKCHSERICWKYRIIPCYKVLFVVERALGTICAVNMDRHGQKHDITVLRESSFYRDMAADLGNWIAVGDTGYMNEPGVAAAVRGNDGRKEMFSKTFWKSFNDARNASEVVFAHFFSAKFPLLSKWKCTSKDNFEFWAKNVMCCVIVYNHMKRETLKAKMRAVTEVSP